MTCLSGQSETLAGEDGLLGLGETEVRGWEDGPVALLCQQEGLELESQNPQKKNLTVKWLAMYTYMYV